MLRHLPISPILFVISLLLAGCASSSVDLESRAINVDQSAEPASFNSIPEGLVNKTGPSYVTLTVSAVFDGASGGKDRNNKSPVTSGSGFVVNDTGYVMTAAHVAVKTGNSVSARAANGRVYSGQVIGILPDNDMALIKLKGFKGHAVSPVSASCLRPGATVFSLGKPHAQGDTARFGKLQSMSFGRAVQYGKFGYPDAMVIHMNTQKGESGGPLFDDMGRLAGMVVSTLSDGNGQPLNMAHAIPSSTLAKFICAHGQCAGSWQTIAQNSGGC
jgi:S1-C subfamily serine protease